MNNGEPWQKYTQKSWFPENSRCYFARFQSTFAKSVFEKKDFFLSRKRVRPKLA
jgi:hypothetical protein